MLLAPLSASAQVLYVDADASGDSTGTSWANAFTDLQTAIDSAAASDSLWVAEGVYTPDSPTDSLAVDFSKDGLKIFGGFDGTESTLDGRDPAAHPTVLSGDVAGDDNRTADGITTAPSGIVGDNANHVVFLQRVTSITVLDGLIITAGPANGDGINSDDGGGLYCDGSNGPCNPTLRNVVFRGNTASFGGAIFNNGANTGTASPQLTNTTFLRNRALDAGGAIYNNGDDGTASPQLVNAVFVRNSATNGGAIANVGLAASGVASPSIINATLTDNSARRGGALYDSTDTGLVEPTVDNTILWDNTAIDSGPESYNTGLGVTLSVDHSVVEGGVGGVAALNSATVQFLDQSDALTSFDGSTNLDVDPQFEYGPLPAGDDDRPATGDDGLHLRPGSPALDSADAAALPTDDADLDEDGDTGEALAVDVTGAPRETSDDEDGVASVDIGAYEGARDQARTIYVDADNPAGPFDGTGWARADTTLQAALALATGNDQVWVAEGTYYPDRVAGLDTNNPNTSFVLRDGVQVYGGFTGGETSLSGRDPYGTTTVLSGDIAAADTSTHVVVIPPGVSRETRLDGVTITQGAANDATADVDGDGTADGDVGGGLYVNAQGAATHPTLANLTFLNNRAGRNGGGLHLETFDADASPELVNVTFVGNTAGNNGGGLSVYASGTGTVDPLVANARFRLNEAGDDGGAAAVVASASGTTTPRLVHLTAVRNQAGTAGGAVSGVNFGIDDSLVVKSSVLWENTAGGAPDQLDGSSSTGVRRSLVQGSGGSRNWGLSAGDEGGNIDADPLLLDAQAGDLHLNWASPAIDEGLAPLPPDSADLDNDGDRAEALPVDATGNPRFTGAEPDMGAYEGGAAPAAGGPLYVDRSAGRDTTSYGGSWGQPYRTLQAALAAARHANRAGGPSFGEIWVAQGTYYPDEGPGLAADTAAASFVPVDSVAVYGGFQNGDAFSARNPDPRTNGTVLSGDIDQSADTTGNSAHVVRFTQQTVSPATVLDGFTITGGTAQGAAVPFGARGGGVLMLTRLDASRHRPALRHLRLTENYAEVGAGLYGRARSTNTAASPLLEDVEVDNNVARRRGGGLVFEAREGTTAPTLVNTRLRRNRADQAGAVAFVSEQGGTVQPLLTNTLVNGNESAVDSAAAVLRSSSTGTLAPELINTTWAQNRPASGPAADSLSALLDVRGAEGTVDVQVANSVFGANAARAAAGGALSDGVRIDASVVEGGWGGAGTGVADGAPAFANPSGPDDTPGTPDDSLQVLGSSPALNRGRAARLPADTTDLNGDGDTADPLPQDLSGGARVLAGQVDAGAYEGAVSPSVAVQAPTAVTSTSAALRGVVVPYAPSASVTFDYRPVGGTFQSTADTTLGGTDSTGVARTVDGLLPDTTYVYRLRATTGTRATVSQSQATFTTPRPSPARIASAEATLGGPAAIDVLVANDFAATDQRTLYARKGGTTAYTPVPLQQEGTTADSVRFEAALPDSLVTPRGVDYYVVLSDGPSTVTVPAGGPAEAARTPRHVPVSFEQLTAPFTLASQRYRMVSIPAAPDDGIKAALKANFGAYDRSSWRLERWRPTAPDGGRYAGYPQLDTLRAGQGFWLITSGDTEVSLASGRTVPAGTPRSVRLEPGWNQVGNPFGFPVPWDTVRTASGLSPSQVDGPVAYRDRAYRPGRPHLEAWTGYFVFNAQSTADTLRIPPVDTSAGPSPQRAEVPAAAWARAARASGAASSSRYTLRLEAQSAAGTASTTLGLWPGAEPGRDRFDRAQVPPIGDAPRLAALMPMDGRTVPHASTLKPPAPDNGGGQQWTLRLRPPTGASSPTKVKLRLSERGSLPDGYRRYVLDLSTNQRIAPGATISLEPDAPRRLKVITGTPAYASAHSDGVDLADLETTLRSSYPNPFTDEATIEYVLSEEQPVTITVYNVLGQRVRTLVDAPRTPGVHRLTWDGTNRYGTKVGSGVYFYRMEAGDVTETQKMVLVR